MEQYETSKWLSWSIGTVPVLLVVVFLPASWGWSWFFLLMVPAFLVGLLLSFSIDFYQLYLQKLKELNRLEPEDQETLERLSSEEQNALWELDEKVDRYYESWFVF